jgi:hypothetical protein
MMEMPLLELPELQAPQDGSNYTFTAKVVAQNADGSVNLRSNLGNIIKARIDAGVELPLGAETTLTVAGRSGNTVQLRQVREGAAQSAPTLNQLFGFGGNTGQTAAVSGQLAALPNRQPAAQPQVAANVLAPQNPANPAAPAVAGQLNAPAQEVQAAAATLQKLGLPLTEGNIAAMREIQAAPAVPLPQLASVITRIAANLGQTEMPQSAQQLSQINANTAAAVPADLPQAPQSAPQTAANVPQAPLSGEAVLPQAAAQQAVPQNAQQVPQAAPQQVAQVAAQVSQSVPQEAEQASAASAAPNAPAASNVPAASQASAVNVPLAAEQLPQGELFAAVSRSAEPQANAQELKRVNSALPETLGKLADSAETLAKTGAVQSEKPEAAAQIVRETALRPGRDSAVPHETTLKAAAKLPVASRSAEQSAAETSSAVREREAAETTARTAPKPETALHNVKEQLSEIRQQVVDNRLPENRFLYTQIPVIVNNQRSTAELYIYKNAGQGNGAKRGKRLDPENVKILLGLDLERAGRVESLISIRGKEVTLKFDCSKSEVVSLVRRESPELYRAIASVGFKLTNVSASELTTVTTPQSAMTALLENAALTTKNGVGFEIYA